jgi:ArsR family transcriptional regulator, arsenate/arsenite/antimonite-responsive transcriptional repressor
MEKHEAIAALAALAQETRLDVFRLLVQAGVPGLPAGAIGEALGVPSATLSFHLKELKGAGVVTCRRKGRSLIYGANFTAMDALLRFLTENCCQAGGCAPAPVERELFRGDSEAFGASPAAAPEPSPVSASGPCC